MNATNIFGILLKFLAFFAVLGIIVLSTGIFAYSFYELFKVSQTIFEKAVSVSKVILDALKAVDLVLLGFVLFIMGVGLFELFITKVENLPDWLIISDLDQLKSMLVKVIIVVMSVSFSGRVITWDGETDLLGYGLGLGVVVFALSYFLNVKKEKTSKN